jgi:hypothetical protein
MTPCSVALCDRPAKTRGWCDSHYTRVKRYGDPRPDWPLNAGQLDRIRRKTEGSQPDECWTFTGAKLRGYGKVSNGYVHRVAYELLVGPIPDGLQLDHLCPRTRVHP